MSDVNAGQKILDDDNIGKNVDSTIEVIVANVLPANCFGPNPFIENITKSLQKYISSFEVIFKFHLLLYILEFRFYPGPSKVKNDSSGRVVNQNLQKPSSPGGGAPPDDDGAPPDDEGAPPDDDDTAIVETSKQCFITGRVQKELEKYATKSPMSKKQIISDINYIIHSHIDRISKQLLTESELKKTLSNVQFTRSNFLIQNIITNQRFLLENESSQILLVRILYKTKQFFKSLAKSIAYFLILKDDNPPIDKKNARTAECLFKLMDDTKIRKIIKAIAGKEPKSIFTIKENEIKDLLTHPNVENNPFHTLYTALKNTRVLSVKNVSGNSILRMAKWLVNHLPGNKSKKTGNGGGAPEESPILTDPRSPANKYMNDILLNATDGIVKQIKQKVNDKMQNGIINKIFDKLGPVGTDQSTSQDYLNTYSAEKHAMNVSLILCVLKTLNKSFIDFLRTKLPESITGAADAGITKERPVPKDKPSIEYTNTDVCTSIYNIIIQQTDEALNTPDRIKTLTENVKSQYMSFIPSISSTSTTTPTTKDEPEDESYKTFFTETGPVQQAFFEAINMFADPTNSGGKGGGPNRSDSRKTRKNIKRNAKRPMRGTRKDRSEEIP